MIGVWLALQGRGGEAILIAGIMTSQRPDPELVLAFRRTVRRHFAEQIAREQEAAETRRAVVVPLAKQTIAAARREGLCGRAWLFGSYAWGEPGERSDVDLLVEDCADTFGLASRVGRVCERDVHVVAFSDAPESLRRRVMEEGLPL